jgi:hypothetical protein
MNRHAAVRTGKWHRPHAVMKCQGFLGKAPPKAQSAMEYLMTYGWAILVIAVVLGVLYSLGIFNPSNFAPKAQPGSCQVFRPDGPKTSYDLNLMGACSGEMPEYAAYFSNIRGSGIAVSGSALLGNATAFTISFWVDPTQIRTSQLGFLDAEMGFGVKYDQPDAVEVDLCVSTQICSGSWTYVTQTAFPQISQGKWVFVVTTWESGGDLVDYVDGVSQTAGGPWTGSLQPYSGTNFDIGQAISGTGATSMTGYISNVQMYNSSLGQNGVNALYHEGIGGEPINLQNLVGWWPLNGNANDYSGNNNNGVPTNALFTGSWQTGYTPP